MPKTPNNLPPPPRGLSKESRKWWRQVLREFQVEDVAGLMVLEQALQALDRIREAQAMIQRDGLVVLNPNTGAMHVHPAAKVENDARQALLRYWKALGLDIEPPGPTGRPPGSPRG